MASGMVWSRPWKRVSRMEQMKHRHEGYNLQKWQVAWFGPAHEEKLTSTSNGTTMGVVWSYPSSGNSMALVWSRPSSNKSESYKLLKWPTYEYNSQVEHTSEWPIKKRSQGWNKMKRRHKGYYLLKWQAAWFGPAHEGRVSRVQQSSAPARRLQPPQVACGMIWSRP